MAWKLDGRYFESCSCDVVCPCTASLELGADYDHCRAALIFHVDDGEVDGVDVSGLTVAVLAETPKYMHEGNWRLGVVMDEQASDEQAEKLGAVFGGQMGGPMEALAPLITEQLGVERMAIDFSSDGGHHSVTLGDAGRVTVDDVVPFGSEDGAPARLVGVFHPAGSELTVARSAQDSRLSAFGIDFEIAGQSGFSSAFSWSG